MSAVGGVKAGKFGLTIIICVVSVLDSGIFPTRSYGGEYGNTVQSARVSAVGYLEPRKVRTYIIPKLIVRQSAIFSAFRISNGHVIHHGIRANTKSIMML